MYASYYYSAGSTAANILADVVAILTGETNKANLSANCDQTNTSISAAVTVAGWSVYDASAGTNAQCLRAAVADNASQYKYMVIDTNSAGYIMTKIYEDWNSTAHTGTNLAYGSNTNGSVPRVNVSLGGRIEIYANVRCCLMYSYQNNLWGNASYSHWSGVVERTRLSPWDTVANGYPPFMFINNLGSGAYEPRYVNITGADVTTSTASIWLGTSISHPANSFMPPHPNTTVVIDADKNLGHAMYPLMSSNMTNGHWGGKISSLIDVYLTTHGYGATYDTLLCGTDEYIIWGVTNTTRLAIRKG